jgi:hypothetical protein
MKLNILNIKNIKNRNIILFLGLILILGIVWLYQTKKREGLAPAAADPPADAPAAQAPAAADPPTPTAASMTALSTSFQSQLAAAGVPAPSPEEISGVLTQLTSLISQEVAATSNMQDATEQAEQATPVVNTVAPILPFPDTTFFHGAKFGDAFCPAYQSNQTDLNNKCSLLTSENCNATDCCIWVNGSKCIAGNATGPAASSGLQPTDYTYYSYKYQCYGSCGSTVGANSGGGGSGGPLGPPYNPCNDDSLTIIPLQCNNAFWDAANCSIHTIPLDTTGYIPMPGSPQYNFTVSDGNLDMTHVPDMNWGAYKSLISETIAANPSMCLVDTAAGGNSRSRSSCRGSGGGGSSRGSGGGGSSRGGSSRGSGGGGSSRGSASPSSDCEDSSMTIIPTTCFNQMASTLNCSAWNIPLNSTGTIETGRGKKIVIANNQMDLSLDEDSNWGTLKLKMTTTVQANPEVCNATNPFHLTPG